MCILKIVAPFWVFYETSYHSDLDCIPLTSFSLLQQIHFIFYEFYIWYQSSSEAFDCQNSSLIKLTFQLDRRYWLAFWIVNTERKLNLMSSQYIIQPINFMGIISLVASTNIQIQRNLIIKYKRNNQTIKFDSQPLKR